MKVFIDTNILYYYFDLETNHDTFDAKTIDEIVKKGHQIYISEITIIEFLVKYRTEKDTIIKILKEIQDKNIIIDYSFNLLNDNHIKNIIDDNDFDNIITLIFNKKIEQEADFAKFVFGMIFLVVLEYYYSKYVKNKNSEIQHIYQSVIIANDKYVTDFFKKKLEEVYNSNDKDIFKNSFENILGVMLITAIIMGKIANGENIIDTFFKKINNNNSVSLFSFLKEEEIDDFITMLKKILNDEKEKGRLKDILDLEYIIYKIKKILYEKTKLDKNDIFDCYLFHLFIKKKIHFCLHVIKKY